MKIKKKGFVASRHIAETYVNAFDDTIADVVVEVEYEIEAPKMTYIQAAAVIGRGGKIQDKDGDVFPNSLGGVVVDPAYEPYIEVPS